jgi:putative protein-disulfide isomerase
MASLIYIADPLCSWCYGFGPQLKTLLAGLPDTPLDIVVGGLRAYNTEIMDDTARQTILMHWREVQEITGLPFRYDALSRPGFIYDTEPACRAVVAARQLAPHAALDVFHAIQHAFYAEAQEAIDGQVLANIVSAALRQAGVPVEPAQFHTLWADEEIAATTRDEFIQTQRWGISGFPTLVLERGGKLDLVTSGFARVETLVERMQSLLEQ